MTTSLAMVLWELAVTLSAADLTVPGLLLASNAALGTVVLRLWLESKAAAVARETQIANLEKKHDAEMTAMQARVDKSQDELKEAGKERLKDVQAFVKLLENKPSESSSVSESRCRTKTGSKIPP